MKKMHFLIEDSDPHTGPGTRDREETDGARPLEGQQRTDDILRAGQHRRGKHNLSGWRGEKRAFWKSDSQTVLGNVL